MTAINPYRTDNAVYQNVGMPATVGADATAENLGQQFAAFPDSYAYRMINIATTAGNTVLTERLDMIKTQSGEVVGLPVIGTFVVYDGKIARWIDYWDTGLPMKMMAGEDVSALVSRGYLSV